MLDEHDDRRFISQLSLAQPHTLHAGHVAHPRLLCWVTNALPPPVSWRNLGIGTVCSYDRQAFRNAVDWITQPDVNLSLRKNALAGRGTFQ